MRVHTIVAMFLALLCTAAVGHTQNLILNGEFDDTVDGWEAFNSGGNLTIQHDNSDRADDPNSGSLLAVNVAPGLGNLTVVQCVESTTDLVGYDLSGWVNVPDMQSGSGSTRIFAYWFPEPDCTGSQTLAMTTGLLAVTNGFVKLTAPTLVAPEGTQSIWVILNVNKQSTVPGSFSVYFDGIDLRRTPEIFVDGFDLGNTDQWSASVGETP